LVLLVREWSLRENNWQSGELCADEVVKAKAGGGQPPFNRAF
jgi:hypothetical protein